MRAAFLLSFASLACACGMAHEGVDAGALPDASAPDAHVLPDAGTDARSTDAFVSLPDVAFADAWSCADGDLDGFADVLCGGDDCDDGDPTVVPGTMRCLSPTRTERCLAGAFVAEECDAATPECDARDGACVPERLACGDGVVHPSEACDDGEATGFCNAECQLNCDFSSMCPAGELCIEPEEVYGHCAPLIAGGLAHGERCSVSAECESAWCDPLQGRCSSACDGLSFPRCPAEGVCEVGGVGAFSLPWTPGAGLPYDGFWRCEYPCGRDADCGSGAVCTLVVHAEGGPLVIYSLCRERQGTGAPGSAPIGSPCDAVLGCDSNICIDGACTRTCIDDADCAAPLPHCVDHDLSSMFSTPHFGRVCDP